MINLDDFKDCMLSFDDFNVNKDYLLDTSNNVNYNKIITEYYKRLIEEGSCSLCNSSLVPKSKIYELENCNKFWIINRYDVNMIKDFVGTYTCKDKFCNNCKKLKQAVRMSRYIKFIENYADNLYHIVFTIPNVDGLSLEKSLDKMSSTFRKLMRIIQGNYRCFIDFRKYKYLGAIRSLEITFNLDDYHPHFHCAFVFRNLDLNKIYSNCYSYSNRSDNVRLFSDFEITLQKLWYMLYNDIPITKNNFDSIDVGYSVIADKFRDNDYVELFKYMTKATDENDKVLSYENFKTLYWATYRLKQIQGYGCFYMIKDDDITKEEIDRVYKDIKFILSSEENPILSCEKPFDLFLDNDYTIISRKVIYQYLKNIKNNNLSSNSNNL